MRPLALVQLLLLPAAHAQTAELCCSVTVAVRSQEGHPIPGAAVRIESGAMRFEERAAENGDAAVGLRTPGPYRATASAQGFESQSIQFTIGRDESRRIELTLVRRESVTVEGRPAPLDVETTASGATRDQVRSLSEHIADVRNALPLIPGVVRTPEGKLQISGSPEYRSTFLVNSIDVTDPATGSFGATVPIDIIETVQVYKSPFLAEYGRFSAAVVAVATRRGGDKLHYELNDPTPEFRIRSGHLHGIRGFTPRLALTGLLLRNRLFFAAAGTFELRKRPVYPLPFPYNEEKTQRVNAYGQLDFVWKPTHLVTVSMHVVPDRANFAGLNFYTPQPAAPSWIGHEYRGTAADHLETGRGAFDTALSLSELLSRTGAQGTEPLTLTPVTSLGNYFFTHDRTSRRGQLAEMWSAKPVTGAGTHTIRIGGAVAATTQDGSASARPVTVAAGTGEELYGLTFLDQRPYRLTDYDGGVFVQDGWEPFHLLRVDAGLRIDHDRLARATTAAPRLGIAWTPEEKARTVVRGGIGWFYDKVPLNAFAFPSYPLRLSYPNLLDDRRGFAPHSRTFSVALDHRLSRPILLHAGFLESDQSRLLVIQPQPAATVLRDTGKATTRELEVTAKLSWYSEQSWIISYTHTYGRGNLNTFDELGGGNFPQPLLRADVTAGLPSIVPHRFLTWGVFPVPYGLRLAHVIEWRSGFPWSALNQYQQYAGIPNTGALPVFFSLDARVSKDIPFRKHKVRVAFSMFNITDHANFDAVRLNTADPQFGEVLGRRPRRYRVDFDWLF